MLRGGTHLPTRLAWSRSRLLSLKLKLVSALTASISLTPPSVTAFSVAATHLVQLHRLLCPCLLGSFSCSLSAQIMQLPRSLSVSGHVSCREGLTAFCLLSLASPSVHTLLRAGLVSATRRLSVSVCPPCHTQLLRRFLSRVPRSL